MEIILKYKQLKKNKDNENKLVNSSARISTSELIGIFYNTRLLTNQSPFLSRFIIKILPEKLSSIKNQSVLNELDLA